MKLKMFSVILALIVVGIVVLVVILLNKKRTIVAPDTIILISIDTIRADHLSCYGYQHKTTPIIDAFAHDAILFENCFANIPLTLPSHTSMLTGVLPPTHGVQDNLSMALSDSVLTLPEILQGHGYGTYGIISAEVLYKEYKLNQGFDVYDDTFDSEITKARLVPERPGDETVEHSLKWLEENQDKKKFMFLHFYDPHLDYLPPAPYDKQFKNPYDGEIAFVDHCVGQIIDKLKTLDLYEDSLIIITGDHGELLGEHGEPAHGYFIYQNVLHVPLIFKPAHHSTPVKITDNTSLTDITPTVLAQCGIEIPSHMQGVDLSDYFVRKKHHIPDRYIFNECLTATKYNGNSLLGVINNQWHYIQTTRSELYDRINDPMELNNLIGQEPKRASFLQKQLRQILEAAVPTSNESNTALNYESRQALKSLGYVGGNINTDFAFDQTREDPKDLLKIHNDSQQVLLLIHDEQYDKAIELCNKIITKYPDIALTYEVLAGIYVELEDYDKAINLTQKKMALLPDDIDTLKFIAETYNRSGNYDQAIHYMNIILKMKPEDAGAYGKLAGIYTKLEEYDKVIDLLQKKLALLPDDIDTLKFLAESYNLSGDYSQAINTIDSVLKLMPDDADTYGKLAGIHMKLKSYDKVIGFLQKKLSLLPDDIDTLKFLAETYNRSGAYSQAINTINSILKLQPDDAETYFYLAKNYHQIKDNPRTLQNCLKALELNPDFLPAQLRAADTCKKMGKLKEAVELYETALQQEPNLPVQHNSLAWIQATNINPELYNPQSALIHAQKAVELSADTNSPAHNHRPYFLDTLSAAQAANGQFDAAIESATLALKLCRQRELTAAADEIQKHLDLYRQHKTYRE